MTHSNRMLVWIVGAAAIAGLGFVADGYLSYWRASDLCTQFQAGVGVDSASLDRSIAGRPGVVLRTGLVPAPKMRFDDVPAKHQPIHDPELRIWGVTFSGVLAGRSSCHLSIKNGRVLSASVRSGGVYLPAI